LAGWTGGRKPVWSCIECTHIGNPEACATPQQVRAEVWMALVRGARGLIYFVHQFKPRFREAALLDDPAMLEAVTGINRQIRELAPVLNGPNLTDSLITRAGIQGTVAAVLKRHEGVSYVFGVNLRNQPVRVDFQVQGVETAARAEVLGESRARSIQQGCFSDEYAPYAVHLYRLVPAAGSPSPG